jgi:prevent-host-death family protein
MKAVVSLEEFRKNLSDIVFRVMYGDQTVVVQKHSKPGVIVMSEREYENLRDPRKRFSSQAEWDSFFVKLDTIKAGMSEKEHEELQQIIDEEVQAVRAEKRQNAKS